jgi:Domain of unknown function (DUF5667)
MRRLFLIALLTFCLIGSTNVRASDTKLDVKAGITPNSRLYTLDLFFEKVGMKLSFNEEQRVKKLLKQAEERLAELNQMDPVEDLEAIDSLYDAYGYKLKQANSKLEKLTIKNNNKTNKKLISLKDQLETTTNNEELLKEHVKTVLNDEVIEQVQIVKTESYLTSMLDSVEPETIQSLRDQNYGVGIIVKLSAFSQLSGLTIEELLALDIYSEDNPNTEETEKDFDFKKIESSIGLSKQDLIKNLKEYHSAVKDLRDDKSNNGNGNPGYQGNDLDTKKEIEERLESIKDSIKEKVNNSDNNKQNGNGNGKGKN